MPSRRRTSSRTTGEIVVVVVVDVLVVDDDVVVAAAVVVGAIVVVVEDVVELVATDVEPAPGCVVSGVLVVDSEHAASATRTATATDLDITAGTRRRRSGDATPCRRAVMADIVAGESDAARDAVSRTASAWTTLPARRAR
jgi:hypothetical protein